MLVYRQLYATPSYFRHFAVRKKDFCINIYKYFKIENEMGEICALLVHA